MSQKELFRQLVDQLREELERQEKQREAEYKKEGPSPGTEILESKGARLLVHLN